MQSEEQKSHNFSSNESQSNQHEKSKENAKNTMQGELNMPPEKQKQLCHQHPHQLRMMQQSLALAMRGKARREKKRSQHNAFSSVKLDSGASRHVFSSADRFDAGTLRRKNYRSQLIDAAGKAHDIVAHGRVGSFENVNLVQGLDCDLISIGQLLDDTNQNIVLTRRGAYLTSAKLPKGSLRIAKRGDDGLYDVEETILTQQAYVMGKDTAPKNYLQLLHARMGHFSPHTLVQGLRKGIITSTNIPNYKKLKELYNNLKTCDTCYETKLTKRARNKTSTIKQRATSPFHTLGLDLCGPVSPQTENQERYYLAIVDVHTNSVYGLPIIRKADAHAAFKEFINTVVTKFKVEQIFRVHSDRDPCLTSGLMKEFFDELKIQYRTYWTREQLL